MMPPCFDNLTAGDVIHYQLLRSTVIMLYPVVIGSNGQLVFKVGKTSSKNEYPLSNFNGKSSQIIKIEKATR